MSYVTMGNTIGMLVLTIIGRDLSHARVCVSVCPSSSIAGQLFCQVK